MARGPLLNTLNVDLRRTAFAGTVALIWETLITLDDEVRFIWVKPNTAWIKHAFLFLRYFPLAIHICNRTLSELVYDDPARLNLSFLRGWYLTQVVVAHMVMSGVELVMMARVYALYNNSRLVARTFVLLWILETIVVFIGLAVTIHEPFEPNLFVTRTPTSFVYLGISTLVSQAVILGLTFAKYLQGEWQGTALIKLLMRDGVFVYFIFFASSLTAAVYSAEKFDFGMAEYSWLLTLQSAVGTRLILNMQRFPERHDDNDGIPTSQRTSVMELTTLDAPALYDMDDEA
uniref:DUF6533 domain-containing protein n=1 Tax=Mycena chlorophos TaxID=658473 RepID=A0ABQ0LZ68_MYCCL|nr:predicted protein [Mycena chlorophos]